MANNKVGHFIHGLKDRVWTDFVCHFHLYKGHLATASLYDSHWHVVEELLGLCRHCSVAVRSSLDFLRNNASEQPSLVPLACKQFSNNNAPEASSSMNPIISPKVSRISNFPDHCEFLKIE